MGTAPAPSQELMSGWDSTGEVKLTKDVDQSMKDRNIILVEDILDTGLTMTYLKTLLMARQPRSLKVAALLDKPSRRKLPLEGDYVGFKIPDEFVVGYGLDYAEKYRNLPDICVVPERVEQAHRSALSQYICPARIAPVSTGREKLTAIITSMSSVVSKPDPSPAESLLLDVADVLATSLGPRHHAAPCC